jgi:hypothetical protein
MVTLFRAGLLLQGVLDSYPLTGDLGSRLIVMLRDQGMQQQLLTPTAILF